MAQSKKEKFNQKNKSNSTLFIIAGVVIVSIIAGIFFLNNGDSNQLATGEKIKEVTITPLIQDNKVIIKKSDVEKNKIVRFEYAPFMITLMNGSQIPFPLMAYVTDSGTLEVASRMCEPCNGLTFSSIDGKILNCDTCGTQWIFDTKKWNGLGAQKCGQFFPEAIEYELNGDDIIIDANDFMDWVPRA